MLNVELILWLLLLTAVFASLARRLVIPYPVVLVLGGLAIGLVPGLPEVSLDPDLVFLLFLPPILYQAGIFTSWRDFRANLRPISALAVGLVIVTTLAVAATARWLFPGLPWSVALVLGAIVSPPDAVAATAVLQRLKVPRRVVTILEGESLVNDASALVLYRFAVAAAVTGSFAWGDVLGAFPVVVAGGIGIGLVIGWLSLRAHRLVREVEVDILLSLMVPFAAYMAAETLEVSGVLATVCAGLVRGWYLPERFSAPMRVQAHVVWRMLIYLVNGVVFILIGFALSRAVEQMTTFAGPGAAGLGRLLVDAATISGVAILVRIAWVFGCDGLGRLVRLLRRSPEPSLPWQQTAIIAWCGLRGIVSLAAALALPFTTEEGGAFLGRELVILLAFAVVFATLVIQGISLPYVIRFLRVGVDSKVAREERIARMKSAFAAMAEIERLGRDGVFPPESVATLRGEYKRRLAELKTFARERDSAAAAAVGQGWRELHRAALAAERRRLLKLRRDRIIGDEVVRRIQFELDIEELRLG
jgi:CPA1 family monovalent cation:H+ antiporter